MSLTTWHKDIKSLKDINQFLFKNETMSDCSFLVKVGETSIRVPAHKYILGGYSPEFYNLFYLMKASSDEIPIDDVSVESLSSFLEFLYTETTQLNMENFGDFLKLADRYSVESFKKFCGGFLLRNISVANVLTLMDAYSSYEFPNFESKCIQKIMEKPLCFEDPAFYEISNRTLTTILKSKELKYFKEITIFKGTNKWAERFCAKGGQPINSENKRLALGSALQHIRFGAMTNTEFSTCNLFENSVLTPKEIIEIFQFIGTNGSTICQYSGVKRYSGIIRKMLFHKAPNVVSQVLQKGSVSILQFSVNNAIFLNGIEIYGLCNVIDSERITIQLLNQGRVTLIENTVMVQYDRTKRTYEILFKEKKLINANEEYLVRIIRSDSYNNGFYNYEINEPANNLQAADLKLCLSYRHNICASIIYSD